MSKTSATTSQFPAAACRGSLPRRSALAVAALAALSACATPSPSDATVGSMGRLELVDRSSGRVLPTYPEGNRRWVVGTPGFEYAVRVCNSTWGRLLAVVSVDGVNVVSGETAAPAQSGYVLGPRECTDIAGWRKNLSHTAAFYFTELPDSYAARTGRPGNVGVVGVAFFPERRPPPIAYDRPLGRMAPAPSAEPGSAADTASAAAADAAGSFDARSGIPGPASESGSAARRDNSAASAPAPAMRAEAAGVAAPPAPAAKIGTGHGRSEDSPTRMVAFERASDTPAQTLAIHYDRRQNLIAMGILPPPVTTSAANPFPAWAPRFVPDPPSR